MVTIARVLEERPTDAHGVIRALGGADTSAEFDDAQQDVTPLYLALRECGWRCVWLNDTAWVAEHQGTRERVTYFEASRLLMAGDSRPS
jgi:glycine cleavage system aminomethyltransferase T